MINFNNFKKSTIFCKIKIEQQEMSFWFVMEYVTITRQVSELIIVSMLITKRDVKDVKFTSNGMENTVHVVIIN